LSANDLTIYTGDDPVEYDDAGGTNNVIDDSGDDCVDNDGTPMDGSADEVYCEDVNSIVANTRNGNDYVEANGCCSTVNGLLLIQATVNGGIDDDSLYGGADTAGDTLNGDDGEDYIDANDGDDHINGLA